MAQRPLLYVDSGQLCRTLQIPLAGKKDRGGEDEKKEKKKRKDKKDKKGIGKHDHGDTKKHKKKKDKDKGDKKKREKKTKNVGLDVTASDNEKRIRKALEKAEERRVQLEKEVRQERQAVAALQQELGKEHQKSKEQHKPVLLVIEDSEEEQAMVKEEQQQQQQQRDEENTTASSSTVAKKTTLGAGAKAPKGAKLQLTRALDELEDALQFLHALVQLYSQDGVAGSDIDKAAVDGHLLVVAEQRTALQTRSKQAMGAPELDNMQKIIARLQAALAPLETQVQHVVGGAASLALHREEWKQERRVAALAQQKKPEQRHVVQDMQHLVAERQALMRRIIGFMRAEQEEEGEEARRKEIRARLKSLLSIANNDQSDVLGLYNRTHAAAEAIERLAADTEGRYGRQAALPEALADKLGLLEQKWVLVKQAWEARQRYLARVDNPKKQEKDRLMEPAVANLPLVQELLLELSDFAMLVEAQANTTSPPPPTGTHVHTNPYKLFALSFDPAE